MDEDIGNLVNTIEAMKVNGVFNPYIDYIRFPFYRNLEKNTKIIFDFPLTVFVGQNGSGKSSTLQALYGCVGNSSPGEFWFATKVDPIDDNSGERPAIIYAYKNKSGEQVEVIKSRIRKGNDPDYWETSRPILSYGMKLLEGGKRNPPIQMSVIYLDFRAILSAFDKYFYYLTPQNLKSKSKKDYLRKRSVHLKNVIDNNKIQFANGNKQNELPQNILEEELETMSFILDKKYSHGKIIRHKFFREWGTSILFKSFDFVYSEAFAGSGEVAVATLVHNVLNVENNSLILLDEPEISLHPGAKKRLKLFLLEQVKRKHLQIVISTHSSNVIEGLPPQSIKVFAQLPNGKFHVKEESYPEEAFFYIGQKPAKEYIIIVEDKLSKEIISSVLNEKGEDTASLFKIEFYPGGHSVIKKDFITVYSQESKKNKFIIFDGDQKPHKEHFNPAEISIFDISSKNFDKTISKLNEKIKDQIGFEIDFNTDGNSRGGNKKQKIDLMIKYLEFYYENVFYLPLLVPEAIIWDEAVIRHFLEFKYDRDKVIDEINSTNDYKEKFRIFSFAFAGCENGENILFAQKVLLNRWLEKKDDNYKKILAIINKILTQFCSIRY